MPLSITDQFLLKLDEFAEKHLKFHTLSEAAGGFSINREVWGSGEDKKKTYFVIRNLKKGRYIEERNKNGKIFYKLTPRGIIKIIKIKIKAKRINGKNKKNRWDGKWRVIIFDIPEKFKRKRDFFRQMLCEFDYQKLQASVWISPYDNLKEMRMLAKSCAIDSFVKFMLAEDIDEEQILIKNFFKD